MKTFRSRSVPLDVSKGVISATIVLLMLAGSGAAQLSAQDATVTAEASGGFIETVGGVTTRELPAPIYYDVDEDGTLNAEELATAVGERYPKMIWPEAYVVPLEDLLAGIEASDLASWPIGAEFRVLEVPVICGWFTAYLDAFDRGDTLQQPAALDQAMYVLGGARGLTPEEALAAVDGIRYATLGDPALIQEFVDQGPCGDPVGSIPDGTPEATPVSRLRIVVR